MSLLEELKRRNVLRVAAAYAVVAWLLIEVADTIFPRLGLPDWTVTFVIALLLLGLPLALFLAWAYDLTPEGLQRTSERSRGEPYIPRPGKRLDRLIAVALAFVIVLLVAERWWFRSASPAVAPTEIGTGEASPARSIAVLAFDDLSSAGDQAYFADGISEELLNLLARIDGLKVAARTSSFKFKGSGTDIREIGNALNVETVLEGSVRKAGTQVRVTAQLIAVDNGFHLWSDSYDRELENIFAVQDEIAASIVQALRLELDIDAETASRTVSLDAYDHYLRGRQLAREPTQKGLVRAIAQFEQAIAIDPGFAGAYSGVAEAWIWLEDYGGVKSAEAFPKAEQAARRALELDPQSAEAHASMAFVRDRYYNDSRAAQEYFERTLEINPNYVIAYNLYGDVLRDLGDIGRMVEVHRAAVELDPLSVFMKTRLAAKLRDAGHPDESDQILEAVFAEFPDNDYAHEELANGYLARGRLADALSEYRLVHFARPGDPYSATQIARIANELGDQGLAQAWIAAARERGEDNRWELFARQAVAESQGDWAELDRIGNLRGGSSGAHQRGVAASRREAWPEARRHLLESLQLGRYDEAKGPLLAHVDTLTELAWVEQQLGLSEGSGRTAAAGPVIAGIVQQGTQVIDFWSLDYGLARIAALAGDRDAALAHLGAASDSGFLDSWFLERDPLFAAWREDGAFRAVAGGIRERTAAQTALLARREVMP